jgi:LytR cell envelope-related transcriptional attenuator
MQTRKRAKSVTFGKKIKEKPEKEIPEEKIEEKKVAPEPEQVKDKEPEKTEASEEKIISEKPASEELSTSLPKTDEKDKEKEEPESVATPANEFVTESPLSSTPESSKAVESEHESATDGKEAVTDAPSLSNEPQPIETPAQPEVTPVPTQPQEQEQPATDNHELSPTPPQSAFTIQSNEGQSPVAMGDGKKRFGLYFFIIAFLSFILGLGAIAAANYFGVIKLSIPQLPVAAKPTPTLVPTVQPTVAPTAASVNMSAYSISVLNGSTVAGKAADVKASLSAAGFKIGTIGNAANSNFTKTEIAAKSTVDKAYLSKLQDELNKSFVVDTTIGTLPASSSSDVTVTLGSQTAQ